MTERAPRGKRGRQEQGGGRNAIIVSVMGRVIRWSLRKVVSQLGSNAQSLSEASACRNNYASSVAPVWTLVACVLRPPCCKAKRRIVEACFAKGLSTLQL